MPELTALRPGMHRFIHRPVVGLSEPYTLCS